MSKPMSSAKVRRSASVLLTRSWDSEDVYLVRRGIHHRAFPGVWVFPGGKVDPEDHDLPIQEAMQEVPAEEYVAAARELFEETGVLLAHPGARAFDSDELEHLRQGLLNRSWDFRHVLKTTGATLDGSHLVPLGEKTTPPFHPRRFRNRFFLAVLPADQAPKVIPGELEEGRWFGAQEAVDLFHQGELALSPPILLLAEAFAGKTAREALPDLRGFSDQSFVGKPIDIRFSPEVVLFPGRTPTLPPATHTNTYLLGRERLLVVDPATPDPADQAKLALLIESRLERGAKLEALVLTHHHVDHIGAVEFLKARFQAPLWGHAKTQELLPQFSFDRLLEDGEVLDLGEGGEIECVHTPGHAPGHLCFFQRKFGALLVGDMISTASTILIDPEDGDMAQYLESLKRLLDFDAKTLYPAHGDAQPQANRLIEYFLKHRQTREDKALGALDSSGQSLAELVPQVYDDTPVEAHPLAARSLTSIYRKLAQEGKAQSQGDTWRLC